MAGFSVFVNVGAKLLPSLNSSASAVERRFGQMNRKLRLQAAETRLAYKELAGALKPIGAMMAASGLTVGFKKAIGEGSSFMHEVAALRISGRTAGEVALAIKQAHKTVADVPTSTLVDNLKILRETTGAYGDMKHAIDNLSFNQRLGYGMTNIMGMDRETANHTLVAGIQALEIRGSAMDHERYQREMSELFKASAFFAGKEGAFTAASLRDFAKTGNIPLKLMGERFMTKILPAMITEVGSGDIVGTQASAFNNWLNGNTGTGNKSKTEFAQRIGLVTKTDTSQLTKTGWKPGAVVGTSLAKSDPLQWVETILLPRLAKAGFNTNDTKSLEIAIASLMGRETAKRFVLGMADPLQRKRLHKDEENINKAMGSEEGYKFMLANDPTAAWAKVMAKLDNLATTLGEKVFTDRTIRVMDRLGGAIDGLISFFDSNPTAAQATVGGMGVGALGATAALFGGGRLIGMLFRSVFVRAPMMIGRMLLGAFMRAGPILASAGRYLGPVLMGGLRLLGPWILRGVLMAFGFLSNPVGWAALAVTAIALVWAFRGQIASAWHFLVDWFRTSAWPAILSTASHLKEMGGKMVDAIIDGLAASWGRLEAWFSGRWSSFQNLMNSRVGFNMQDGVTLTPPAAPKVDGKRAGGGNVRAGHWYQINERGQELFAPGRSGTIIPHHQARRMGAGGGGMHIGEINVHGASDPHATALAVRAELARYARQQEGFLND